MGTLLSGAFVLTVCNGNTVCVFLMNLLKQDENIFFFSGDEDTAQMQYFWLYKGEAKRCFCGHFFQLKEITAADFPQYPREENRTEWEGDL